MSGVLALDKTINSIPKLGDHGKDVVVLQTALVGNGIKVTVDGLFGAKTKKAVSDFQKKKGLHGSGIIGPKTIGYLGLYIEAISPITGKKSITSNLIGKRENRILHPTLRLLIEDKVFTGGNIPRCFVERDIKECAILVGKSLLDLGVREVGGNNKGEKVGQIQSIIGTYNPKGTGDAWCMSTMQCIVAFLEDYFKIESPVEDSEHCVTVFNAAKKVQGLVASELLEEGAMFIGRHGNKSSGHTGLNLIVTKPYIVTTIEGNTGPNSISDGDGLHLKNRDIRKIGDLKILGSVRFYPYNFVGA